tara:strand:+ start:741 stop:1484 length:744 start_codon:yes stop_codon:yes gene_type:complete
MAIFNVTTGGSINLPPTQVGDITINLTFNQTYVFTIADFTTLTTPIYTDPEGDAVQSVKIVTLPTIGGLLLSAVAVTVGQEISLVDITGGNLTYVADIVQTAGYTDSDMTFNIADDGSGSYGVITPGIVTFTVAAEINLPPSAVGDNTINMVYGEFRAFTRADFTSATTPVYTDPEGDAEQNLKILSLPADGQIVLSGTAVIVNQVIPFSTIDLGTMLWVPDISIKTAQNLTFNFAVSDVGSGQYTS